ncbi:hypothetical protein F2P81_001220 [Scophthalmus maximus]|uniref:Uncharacterized protein n=1 Tax=Scophthalmus maximus TaxID=52904 RepID=A0A6A4TL27_SCOMX|nr:hypothetical protein F2P81_001220 [Scophthalmus maximus]
MVDCLRVRVCREELDGEHQFSDFEFDMVFCAKQSSSGGVTHISDCKVTCVVVVVRPRLVVLTTSSGTSEEKCLRLYRHRAAAASLHRPNNNTTGNH